MRIVTRPDFDGVVCAALLMEAEKIDAPILWAEPNEMQRGLVQVSSGDIIANLPYNENCAMWFDHHFSNEVDKPFKGAFRIAPSAARIVFEYFEGRFTIDYTELIHETDRIDSADLTLEEVLHPEKFPYFLLSQTITGHDRAQEAYWNRLAGMLRHKAVHQVLQDEEVRRYCDSVVSVNNLFKSHLTESTTLYGHVAVTDFRHFAKRPTGNRFLIYSLFPEAVVSMTILNDHIDTNRVVIKVGHSIFNRGCNVNAGLLLSRFEGGGHRGAGSCKVPRDKAEAAIDAIFDILRKNESID